MRAEAAALLETTVWVDEDADNDEDKEPDGWDSDDDPRYETDMWGNPVWVYPATGRRRASDRLAAGIAANQTHLESQRRQEAEDLTCA